MAKSADRYFDLDTTRIIERGFHAGHALESESVFSLANEHMGIRGYFDEGGTLPTLRGNYLGGVYETEPFRPDSGYLGFIKQTHYMVTAADVLATRIRLGDEQLDLNTVAFSDFVRVLDLQTGLLSRSFVWETRRNGRIELRFERLLGMERPELAAQRITFCALDEECTAEIMLSVDGNRVHETTGQCLWEDRSEEGAPANRLTLRTATTETSVRYTLNCVCPGQGKPSRAMREIAQTCTAVLPKGKEITVERTVAVQLARGSEAFAPIPEFPGFNTILAENTAHWRTFWQQCDVRIEGDLENQQGVRYCLFQLHSTYRGQDARDNIGAKGLTGEAYNGHAFWDTETYALPYYLLTDPAAARSLVMYRYRTLPQARARAEELGLKGACYPVATLDGTEACTLWQHSSLQMQPSTAVAYAIETYVDMTGDTALLQREGAEMLAEIARYVLSRGGWNDEGFGFYGVMGPDEFHMMVDNDFYTNFMGQKALQNAADAVDGLTPQAKQWLAGRIGLTDDEPEAWRKAAEHMLFNRRPDGVFEQHDGYFRMPHIDVQAIPGEEFPLYAHWSYDRIYRTDMIKQPDVLMAMFLYPQDFTSEERAANYAFYEPRCIHESSLSPSVHAVIASRLGMRDAALRFFGFATRLDLDNYNRNTREGLHLSSVAAAWVTIVEGFGGVRMARGEVALAPWLPDGWSRLCFSLKIKNSLLRVDCDAQSVALRCEGAPLTVEVYGEHRVIGERECRVARREKEK